MRTMHQPHAHAPSRLTSVQGTTRARVGLVMLLILSLALVQPNWNFLRIAPSFGMPSFCGTWLTLCGSVLAACCVNRHGWNAYAAFQVLALILLIGGCVLSSIWASDPAVDFPCSPSVCYVNEKESCKLGENPSHPVPCNAYAPERENCGAKFCATVFDDCNDRFKGFTQQHDCATSWVKEENLQMRCQLILVGTVLLIVVAVKVLMNVFGAIESMEKAPVFTTAHVISLAAEQCSHPFGVQAIEVTPDADVPVERRAQGYRPPHHRQPSPEIYSRFDISQQPLLGIPRAEREMLVESIYSPWSSSDSSSTPTPSRPSNGA